LLCVAGPAKLTDVGGEEVGEEPNHTTARKRYSARPHPFLLQASGQNFKDDVNGFPSSSDICFMKQKIVKFPKRKGDCDLNLTLPTKT
jgi:hypothetical protein